MWWVALKDVKLPIMEGSAVETGWNECYSEDSSMGLQVRLDQYLSNFFLKEKRFVVLFA